MTVAAAVMAFLSLLKLVVHVTSLRPSNTGICAPSGSHAMPSQHYPRLDKMCDVIVRCVPNFICPLSRLADPTLIHLTARQEMRAAVVFVVIFSPINHPLLPDVTA